jgi:glutathione peroxidase-family protein
VESQSRRLAGIWAVIFAAVFSGQVTTLSAAPSPDPLPIGTILPAFTHREAAEWINSGPLTTESLRGSVVLLDFWTFACWNCYRSFPWLNDLEDRYHERGLRIIGVHTPEFAYERVRAILEKKIAEFGIRHPVMMDNDMSYWNAMGNRYWPAFYLIDRRGHVRGRYAGETHRNDPQARRIETDVETLLKEPKE